MRRSALPVPSLSVPSLSNTFLWCEGNTWSPLERRLTTGDVIYFATR